MEERTVTVTIERETALMTVDPIVIGGPQGPAGPAGPQGAQGPQGSPGSVPDLPDLTAIFEAGLV